MCWQGKFFSPNVQEFASVDFLPTRQQTHQKINSANLLLGAVKNKVMKKETYTREEVIKLVDEILQYPNQVIDAVSNENTDLGAEDLIELAEKE